MTTIPNTTERIAEEGPGGAIVFNPTCGARSVRAHGVRDSQKKPVFGIVIRLLAPLREFTPKRKGPNPLLRPTLFLPIVRRAPVPSEIVFLNPHRPTDRYFATMQRIPWIHLNARDVRH
jgi:hypothetical protein